VANVLNPGTENLVLLGIDPGRVRPEIRHDPVEGGAGFFPHIYGPLNTDAVVEVTPFRPDADGRFPFP
jgi:uncharacterized protein (DUF952 family)